VNCEKITYYIEKGLLTDLNISEKMQIKLHTMMCKCCKNYAPDSKALNDVISLLNKEVTDKSALSDQEKDQLKLALENLE
jgi:hypothetical protein